MLLWVDCVYFGLNFILGWLLVALQCLLVNARLVGCLLGVVWLAVLLLFCNCELRVWFVYFVRVCFNAVVCLISYVCFVFCVLDISCMLGDFRFCWFDLWFVVLILFVLLLLCLVVVFVLIVACLFCLLISLNWLFRGVFVVMLGFDLLLSVLFVVVCC